MGAVMILGRFRGADTVEPPNVGKVWSTVAGIDNLQSSEGGYKLSEGGYKLSEWCACMRFDML